MSLPILFHRRWMALLVLGLLLLSGLRPARAAADDASQFTQPPPVIYRDTLAKLLTPAEDILKREPDYAHLQGDGVVLLDEVLHFVDDNGIRYSIYHYVDKAVNAAGVRSLSQDGFTFKKNSQHVYLISAQTIQPDGTRDPVKGDAIFLKTPQAQLGDAIYDDNVSMELVFSNVKPGSITERIVLLEEPVAKIPGEFTQVKSWTSSWPVYWQRVLVNLPQSYANRLKISSLGQAVPSPVTSLPSATRQQWLWEKFNTPAVTDDKSDAPIMQTGPLLWLTTLPNWDAFAAWYDGLTKDTVNLTPDLKTKIDGWTSGTQSPAEILRILYEHVARDIRYTGFELGLADLQPHDCMSVWERQYGDCKDKANLLRAMLAYKGITSWLALLSTEHAGLIDKDSPDFRQFDHCILAVQTGTTTTICDPTIAYGEPGILSGGDSDRDLLLIKGNHAEWFHSPALQGATLDYTFDLQLQPAGDLAGWVEKKSAGYYAASSLNYFKDLSKDQLLDSLQDSVRNVFPNANVADVTPIPDPPPPGGAASPGPLAFTLRAYMVLPGVLSQGAASTQLPFPNLSSYLPNTDNYKNREHASYFWPDSVSISVKIHLPPGWKPASIPAPITYDSSSTSL